MNHPDIDRAMLTGYPRQAQFVCESCSVEVKDDNPVEDMFGSEIMAGDTWFEDPDGRVVLKDNFEDYLIEVIGAEFFRVLK